MKRRCQSTSLAERLGEDVTDPTGGFRRVVFRLEGRDGLAFPSCDASVHEGVSVALLEGCSSW
jgi:hypothetical protein